MADVVAAQKDIPGVEACGEDNIKDIKEAQVDLAMTKEEKKDEGDDDKAAAAEDEADVDVADGSGLAVGEGGGVLSPLSGAYLLVVLGEPISEDHKAKIVAKLRQGRIYRNPLGIKGPRAVNNAVRWSPSLGSWQSVQISAGGRICRSLEVQQQPPWLHTAWRSFCRQQQQPPPPREAVVEALINSGGQSRSLRRMQQLPQLSSRSLFLGSFGEEREERDGRGWCSCCRRRRLHGGRRGGGTLATHP